MLYTLSTLLFSVSLSNAALLRVPTDYPTIQAALNATLRGDTVLVDNGTYSERVTISTPKVTLLGKSDGSKIVFNAPVLSMSADSAKVIGFEVEALAFGKGQAAVDLEARSLLVEACRISGGWAGAFVHAMDASIRRSHISNAWTGILLAGTGSSMFVEECDIIGNVGNTAGGGILIIDGTSAVVTDCRIANNSASVFGGAIAAEEDPGGGPAQLVLERCLLYGNAAPIGASLSTINAEASVRSCTIVDNTVTSLNGSVVDLENTVGHAVEIGQCIIAFNAGDALGCFLGAMPQVSCCDIFENSDDSICGKDLGGNLSVDPAFCAMDQSDFHLLEGSPCAPLNSPPGCNLIGALPTMCVNSVHPSTWGAVKYGFLPEGGKR